MADRKLLRLSATLLILGEVALLCVQLALHPGAGPTEEATFALYAASSAWAAIHLAQFVCTAVWLAGLLVLCFALGEMSGSQRWLGFFGALAAGVTLVLVAVDLAVDGVALKQAVDAWASAPAAEQPARFASAQAIRWLEWGAASYQTFTLGLALVLFAILIVWTVRVTRPIGYLMALSGFAFIVAGWVIGNQGFGFASTVPTLVGFLFLLASAIWLLIVAWRMRQVTVAMPQKPATA